MNTKTQKSKHPYHHIIIGQEQDHVTLCICNHDGKGGYDHWRVDKSGYSRVHGMSGNSFFQDYWIDYVDGKIIDNVYKVLDFYANISYNEEEDWPNQSEGISAMAGDTFIADDIPF